jgi:putative two-component system response regulator
MDKKRILLVDDESGFTHLVKAALPGYEICELNDASKAIETARRFNPDLILLDVIMPEVDGGTLAAAFRQDTSLRKIPIVFLTAIVSPGEAASHPDIGGFAFLPKPVSREKLVQCIEEHLA